MTATPLPVIVAAAGQSRRYGRPKLLESMPGRQGQTLINHVINELASAGAGPILVVMGSADEPPYGFIIKELMAHNIIKLHISPTPLEMRDSITAGMEFLDKHYSDTKALPPSHVLFMPADIPGICRSYVRELIKVCSQNPAALIRGVTLEGRGVHPVALAWSERGRIGEIPADKGLNELWKNPELSRCDWPWAEPNSHLDLDNPRDWDKFRQGI